MQFTYVKSIGLTPMQYPLMVVFMGFISIMWDHVYFFIPLILGRLRWPQFYKNKKDHKTKSLHYHIFAYFVFYTHHKYYTFTHHSITIFFLSLLDMCVLLILKKSVKYLDIVHSHNTNILCHNSFSSNFRNVVWIILQAKPIAWCAFLKKVNIITIDDPINYFKVLFVILYYYNLYNFNISNGTLHTKRHSKGKY